jgi:hypothetical protein
MDGFTWALDNLANYGGDSPHGLQAWGVNVYFAPNIAPNTKVVNLDNGRVERFLEGEDRPKHGYYADFESLVRFCRKRGLALIETNGQVSTDPIEKGEAGDPLLHGGTEQSSSSS